MAKITKKETSIYEDVDSEIEVDDISEDIDIDDVLTDDLLDSSDDDFQINNKKKKMTKKKTITKKKASVKRKSSNTTKKGTTRKTIQTKLNPTKTIKLPPEPKLHKWNKERMKNLAEKYPDNYWKYHADAGYEMIDAINEDNQLESIPCNMNDQGPITSMSLSEDGSMLATYSNIGAVKIWDIENDFSLVRKLRDADESHIDEFYCGTFIADSELIAVGGKLKDRYRWSEEDEDNHILSCAIKIFNVTDSKVVAKLSGHEEEILCIKKVKFLDENYLISTSQDGYIFKWHMSSDWTTLISSNKMVDEQTCMAFTVSFVPNTGNKYFIAATDEHLRLYDFEEGVLLQTFSDLYSSYCDCGKFVKWLDESIYFEQQQQQKDDIMDVEETTQEKYTWFISRGAEMCDVSEGVSSKPNTCTLHKLIYPTTDGGEFRLEEVKRYQNEDYHSNSWLVKITSNGRYLLAPTIYGQIFVFNMLTGQVTAILKDHLDMEVRDVIFHPYRPLIFSSGDDGCVKVYTYKSDIDKQLESDLGIGMAEVKIDDEERQ
ncbi:WD40-repeat-containing domain protein [Cokeromyces recurvatus]|uniref:WD40-repeat-containing domain protein n=1 Tax=Cokeromyces recurvatus TaxID=90255 RepID=UPI00221F2CBC|nr:WD40-repeat-containing domain protein [Cokeromyces recurvatus]KAI7905051.1 WD40-repeat-containing domain protein [Cokeromyces recurvatus]